MVETSIDRLTKSNGTLILTHEIYNGERRIEFDVLANYSFYMDNGMAKLRVKYDFPSVKSLPEDRGDDYRLLCCFGIELDKILWNKTVDQLFGKKIRRN